MLSLILSCVREYSAIFVDVRSFLTSVFFFYHIEVTRDDKPFLDAIKESPASVLVAIICFFSVWSVLGLAGFHTYLTTSNQTTNEDVRTTFLKKSLLDCTVFVVFIYLKFN